MSIEMPDKPTPEAERIAQPTMHDAQQADDLLAALSAYWRRNEYLEAKEAVLRLILEVRAEERQEADQAIQRLTAERDEAEARAAEWQRAAAEIEREYIAERDQLQAQLSAVQGWQPIESAPRDRPFLVCWAPSRMGERKPVVEMVGGWQEYEECRSYGEPEAYGWHPLPAVLLSPLSAPPLTGQEPSQ